MMKTPSSRSGVSARPIAMCSAGSSPSLSDSCTTGTLPDASPRSEVYYNQLGLYDTVCDSQSAIGPNAVSLYEEIKRRYLESGRQRVILIGYSQGAAIIRGALDYQSEPEVEFPDQMVESVFFIHGAHDGSPLARAGVVLGDALQGPLGRTLTEAAADRFGPNTSRPAIHDLNPFGPR